MLEHLASRPWGLRLLALFTLLFLPLVIGYATIQVAYQEGLYDGFWAQVRDVWRALKTGKRPE